MKIVLTAKSIYHAKSKHVIPSAGDSSPAILLCKPCHYTDGSFPAALFQCVHTASDYAASRNCEYLVLVFHSEDFSCVCVLSCNSSPISEKWRHRVKGCASPPVLIMK
ncbi:unnamed protein product [Clavelina lepadiformis]|uniref:Uncharacterized protein n=1 Tax=Clavelina lepadiformis TaxID=159417 RepID=A0ABP0GTD6_CLALP